MYFIWIIPTDLLNTLFLKVLQSLVVFTVTSVHKIQVPFIYIIIPDKGGVQYWAAMSGMKKSKVFIEGPCINRVETLVREQRRLVRVTRLFTELYTDTALTCCGPRK
jgi:hypothetical protein